MREIWNGLRHPVDRETRELLDARWRSLDPSLQRWNQVLGRQVVHCAFTMGAPYCSLACTHCYLPKNANRVPLPSRQQMSEQIRASREAVGSGGSIQITGGDVIDAYLRDDRFDELVEIVKEAVDAGLIPMVMTHGQGLLDDPARLDRLVLEGGLRQVSFHVDITQTKRPGHAFRELRRESDLHPLRDRLVDLVLGARRRTGRAVSAAHTLTVTEENLPSLGDVIDWMLEDPRHLDVFHILSLQPAATVGRTRTSFAPTRAEQTWRQIAAALNAVLVGELPDEGLLFGHPKCSRVVPLLVFFRNGAADLALPIIGDDEPSRGFWDRLLSLFGGAKGTGGSLRDSAVRKLSVLARHPAMGLRVLAYAQRRLRLTGSPWRLAQRLARGQARSFALVMHSFMNASEVDGTRTREIQQRLDACAFRGSIMRDGRWLSLPMCEVNAGVREQLYSDATVQSIDGNGL